MPIGIDHLSAVPLPPLPSPLPFHILLSFLPTRLPLLDKVLAEARFTQPIRTLFLPPLSIAEHFECLIPVVFGIAVWPDICCRIVGGGEMGVHGGRCGESATATSADFGLWWWRSRTNNGFQRIGVFCF